MKALTVFAELPPLQIVGSPQGQNHAPSLVKLIPFCVAAEIVVVVQQ
jgi:hypothetical protein